jgi:hypothetical protein
MDLMSQQFLNFITCKAPLLFVRTYLFFEISFVMIFGITILNSCYSHLGAVPYIKWLNLVFREVDNLNFFRML